ncbi:myophilin-like isoform X1 [Lytechinus variegatus]|uniref:myophilin-like isoform X4 n=1 Tax=Lytechinus variegatus TaxID=7654 RepID=UPI001BB1495D|nr:myophilin-like isoform X4 [Lytechinus variegatus]XP_041463015.1 myophilin-like isoform X1 [Lytechinus variegatus]
MCEANRGPSYGDLRQRQMKIESKRDPELERQCIEFIVHHTGETVNTFDDLKNGVILCKLINSLKPGAVKKVENATKNTFAKRANLESFIQGCKTFGLKDQEVFQVNDLFENKNIPQFTQCIVALGRYAQGIPGYDGPILGPKQSEENQREFTQEQMDAGKHMIGLQMGQNKGASQAGGDFGRPRQIHSEFK